MLIAFFFAIPFAFIFPDYAIQYKFLGSYVGLYGWGEWGGSAVVDKFGTCDSNPENDCVWDCFGVWGGG